MYAKPVQIGMTSSCSNMQAALMELKDIKKRGMHKLLELDNSSERTNLYSAKESHKPHISASPMP